MPETDNIFTEVVIELREEMAAIREESEEFATKFLHEKVQPSQVMRRSSKMTLAQRKESLDSIGGRDALLEMIHNANTRRNSDAEE